jgi:Cu(I)/Ag(I) efflux system membrane protein CusA/SilA
MEGTVMRVRPKLMTVATMLAGLIPLLWATGSGADVMKRIAAPMVGGLFTSAFLTLEIIPVVYTYWRQEQLMFERLEKIAPRLRARLRRIAIEIGLGFTALASVIVLPIYVDIGRREVLGWAAAIGVFTLLALISYFRARPQARRAAWRA